MWSDSTHSARVRFIMQSTTTRQSKDHQGRLRLYVSCGAARARDPHMSTAQPTEQAQTHDALQQHGRCASAGALCARSSSSCTRFADARSRPPPQPHDAWSAQQLATRLPVTRPLPDIYAESIAEAARRTARQIRLGTLCGQSWPCFFHHSVASRIYCGPSLLSGQVLLLTDG